MHYINKEKYIRKEDLLKFYNEWSSIETKYLDKQLIAMKIKRGYAFEKIIYSLLTYDNLNASTSFRPEGEEIDGSFKWNNLPFLVEAKWHAKPIEASKLYSFKGKVEGKFHLTSGIFISMSNYSPDCESALRYGKKQDVILFEKEDIEEMILNSVPFSEILEYKYYEASFTGVLNISYKSKNLLDKAIATIKSDIIAPIDKSIGPRLMIVSFDQKLLELGKGLIDKLMISKNYDISTMTYIAGSTLGSRNHYILEELKNFIKVIRSREKTNVIFIYPDEIIYRFSQDDINDFRDEIKEDKLGLDFYPIILKTGQTEFEKETKERIENFLIDLINPNRLF